MCDHFCLIKREEERALEERESKKRGQHTHTHTHRERERENWKIIKHSKKKERREKKREIGVLH